MVALAGVLPLNLNAHQRLLDLMANDGRTMMVLRRTNGVSRRLIPPREVPIRHGNSQPHRPRSTDDLCSTVDVVDEMLSGMPRIDGLWQYYESRGRFRRHEHLHQVQEVESRQAWFGG